MSDYSDACCRVICVARYWHVSAGALSFEVRLNCSRIAGRFDYEPLLYRNYLEAVDAYSARLQYSGVGLNLFRVHVKHSKVNSV